MTWDLAGRFLSDQFAGDTKTLDWLRFLPSSVDGELLGLCLAIDIAAKALKPGTIMEIVKLLDVSAIDHRHAFHIALAQHRDHRNLICASLLGSPRLMRHDHYVRVVSLESFLTHFVGPTLPIYLPLSPSSKVRARRRYLGPKGGSLAGIDRWWSGTRGVTWVLSAKTLDDLIRGNSGMESASIVNDAAGLCHPLKTELMIVRYPREFDTVVGVKQPTALDCDWTHPGTFFISFGKQDGWGRTQSCSGSRPGVPERVHGELKNPTSDYKTETLGLVERLEINRAGLMAEGYVRLSGLLKVAH
jgi:hypothetical protein